VPWRFSAADRSGRVETANYRTAKLPSDVDVPLFVKQDFGAFYKAMFDRVVDRYSMRAVVVEYAGDIGFMGKCDPCTSVPISNKELVELGTSWIGSDDNAFYPYRRGQGANTYVTRMHLRYDATSFPEDLALMETGDRTNFQGRYVLRYPWSEESTCVAGDRYLETLPARFRHEAENLAGLTGWSQAEIETRMEAGGQSLQRSR
jgi:hypothetical protein